MGNVIQTSVNKGHAEFRFHAPVNLTEFLKLEFRNFLTFKKKVF